MADKNCRHTSIRNCRLWTGALLLVALGIGSAAAQQPGPHADDSWAADTQTCDGLDWRSVLIDEDVPVNGLCFPVPSQASSAPTPAEASRDSANLRALANAPCPG